MLGMGLGVGAIIDRNDSAPALLSGLTYFEFMAPGLLATTGMMVCSSEALWPVHGGFKWFRTFHAQAASPLSPGEITAGLTLWHATRSLIAVSGVAVVLVLFEGTRTPGLFLATLFGALTGVAFAAPLTAWSSTRETEYSFTTLMRFIITPLFLFGGAFYPLSQLPGWLQPIGKATPLWHGVELCRNAIHGQLEWASTTLHVSVLGAYTLAGMLVAQRSFARKLAL